VLILGETGTGKELAARAVHRCSGRPDDRFRALNCAALPPHLIESELFGHERGAFTGAERRREGLVGEADGGTLFLDEIGDLPLQAQGKLLRFLAEGRFKRVGGTVEVAADVKVIAATHRDLLQMVGAGSFRQDLYQRIAALEVTMPALREHGRTSRSSWWPTCGMPNIGGCSPSSRPPRGRRTSGARSSTP
jgi:transcriptional regulator with PAS, ATPase and Fis domain